jgi:hypothetical protein
MSRTRLWIAAGSLATALTACPARTPAPPPAVPSTQVQVPPGCERSQTGEYQHADNPGFRYQGADDGSTLTLAVTRGQQEAAATPDGGTAVSIVLERTPEGFVGETRATAFTAAGTACPVSFPTRAVGCDDQGLTLRSVSALALDEDCRPATHGPQPEWKEQRLLKREAQAQPAPDAGLPSGDAGD